MFHKQSEKKRTIDKYIGPILSVCGSKSYASGVGRACTVVNAIRLLLFDCYNNSVKSHFAEATSFEYAAVVFAEPS